MTTVDARGLNCPQPVIKTKQALDTLEAGDSITTIVSTEVASKNVQKLATKLGCAVSVEQKDGDFYLQITKTSGDAASPAQATNQTTPKSNDGTVVFCSSDQFGVGSKDLSAVLIKGFFYALTQLPTLPQTVIFMNSGINLSLNGSPVLDSLKELEAKGTEILSCGTCLDFYEKKDELAVGEITNMYTATEILASATRIIKP